MKKYAAFGFLSILLISGCSGNNTNNNEPSEEPKPKQVNVFLMGGQSNMEGNTYFQDDNGKDYLRPALEELGIDDGDCCYEGIPEVKTSYYGGATWYIGGNSMRGSNKSNPFDGEFLDTKVGFGCGVPSAGGIGPELGLAYNLRDHFTKDEPVYLIKCAFGGSSMSGGGNWGWDPTISNGKSIYKDQFKKFVDKNLEDIEEIEGMKPTIKGFLWHQGENDSSSSAASQYKTNLEKLVGQVREDYADYAVDEDGKNIAFIDCYIYDKGDSDDATMPCGAKLSDVKVLNEQKRAFSEESDMNFIVNSSWQYEDGLQLQIQVGNDDTAGGGIGQQHYYTKDMFLLGQAYADIIVENDLLD
ncbi:MAG: sialate O-acetylesterase [Bacilli bacterium]|nr:sialate O-acetylesterase [Bacilli bacterium]